MSTLPQYPADDLDRSSNLLGAMGTYWSEDFGDAAVVKQLVASGQLLQKQTNQQYQEARETLARSTVPIHQLVKWQLYWFSDQPDEQQSRQLPYQLNGALYGAEGRPPFNRLYRYGDLIGDATQLVYGIPEELQGIEFLVDHIEQPSILWSSGIEYTVDPVNHVLAFSVDPRNLAAVPRRTRIRADGVVAQDIGLWGYGARLDMLAAYQQYGFVVKLPCERSTGSYRDVLKAIYRSHQDAPTAESIQEYLAAVMDVPRVQHATEVIKDIVRTVDALLIITDLSVYRASPASDPSVAIGDTVEQGEFLTDTVELYDPRNLGDLANAYASSLTATPVYRAVYRIYNEARGYWTEGILDQERWALKRFMVPGGGYQVMLGEPEDVNNPSGGGTGTQGLFGVNGSVGRDKAFQGYFGNEEQTLSLPLLPSHQQLRVGFDLLVVGDWQGNVGQTTWELWVDGVRAIHTSFSNYQANGADPGIPQAYPDSVGDAMQYPAHTGAYESEFRDGTILSYTIGRSDGNGKTARYRFDFTIPHTKSSCEIVFKAAGLPTDTWHVINPMPISEYQAWYWDADEEEWRVRGSTARNYRPYTKTTVYTGEFTTAEFVQRYGWSPVDVIYNPDGKSGWERGALVFPSAFWGLQNVEVDAQQVTRRKLSRLPSDVITTLPMAGVTLAQQQLVGAYFGDLMFPNREVPLVVTSDAQGRTVARFEVAGYPADVEQYWEDLHASGIQKGRTLAQLLDQRAQQIGEPSAADLPATVNPMVLVMRHLLSYNTVIVKLRMGLEGPDAYARDTLGRGNVLGMLRRITLPHTSVLLLLEINVEPEDITFPSYSGVSGGQGPTVAGSVEFSSTGKPYVQYLVGTLV